ncbi:uncharacterized protein [Prorops nasuta]|uniref:uncharacterized protein n=1 Tax=Prorops nasuta TaxID=863751 RepID=UPI0034CD6119
MAEPMQDQNVTRSQNVITATINDKPLEGTHVKNLLDHLSQMEITCMYDNSKYNTKHLVKEDGQSNDRPIETYFPWLEKFKKILMSSVGTKNFALLECLLSVYTQNVSISFEICSKKICHLTKLSKHFENALIFFHFYWNDLKKPAEHQNSYLSKMSILLGIYVNIKFETSTRNNSDLVTELFTKICIYLFNSEEHIFRTLLKIMNVNKKHIKICDPMFMKYFANLSKNSESMTDIEYSRYLLAFKLRMKLKETTEKRNDHSAFKLNQHMSTLAISKNSFRIKSSHEANVMESCNSSKKLNNAVNLKEKSKSDNYILHCNSLKNSNKIETHKKTIPRKRKKGKPIIIDLTEEDEREIVQDKNKKKLSNKRKLEWLNIIKNKSKHRKKFINVGNCKQKCKEKVDTTVDYGTNNSDDCLIKKSLKQIPVIDNKISENTEVRAMFSKRQVNNIVCMCMQNNCKLNQTDNIVKSVKHHQYCECCAATLEQCKTQYDHVIHLLKLLKIVSKNVKDPQILLDFLKEIMVEYLEPIEITLPKDKNINIFPNILGKEESYD